MGINPVAASNSTILTESLESKITEVHEYIEKYDLPGISHLIQDELHNMNAISNRIMENVSKWEKKSLDCAAKIISENKNITRNDGDVKIKLETACDETSTIKVAENLLFESLSEQDKYLKNLYEEK